MVLLEPKQIAFLDMSLGLPPLMTLHKGRFVPKSPNIIELRSIACFGSSTFVGAVVATFFSTKFSNLVGFERLPTNFWPKVTLESS